MKRDRKNKGHLIFLYDTQKDNRFLKEADIYLTQNPNEFDIRMKRAIIYRKLGMFEESINDLKYILLRQDNDIAITRLYFLYYYLNKYEEALELLPALYHKNTTNNYSLSITELVMKKQLDIPIKLKKDVKSIYIRSQIFNYSTTYALEHIKSHLDEQSGRSYFNKNIDLNYLLNIIRQNIDNSKKINKEDVLETHCFAISNIGFTKEGNVCNYLKVVVVPNTNNVITMYPSDYVAINNIYNLEFDYDRLFKVEKTKVKTLSRTENSRIDKFNKKYNRV